MSRRRADIDWEAIRLDYEAGALSDRALGKKHGLSHVGVAKRAKAEEWARSLAGKIKARTEQLVTNAAVTTPVTTGMKAGNPVTEKTAVEVNAAMQANLILEQRGDVSRLRSLIARFQAQVERFAETEEDREVMAQLMASLLAGDDPQAVQKATVAVRKVLNTTAGLDCLDKLTRSYERVFKLQRIAFGISNSDENPEDSYEVRLKRLYDAGAL